MRGRGSILLVAAAAILAVAATAAGGATGARARAVTFMLDWFPNPDHVPVYAAVRSGYFSDAGLRVTLQVPSNADDPLKLVAAGKVDVAVNYESNVILARAQGLPVRSIGLLVSQPLTTVMYLKSSGIRRPRDLVGRRVGFAVSGLEDAMIDQIMNSDGAAKGSVTLVTVGFDLVPALLSHKVDAVVGAYRNVERVQIEMQGQSVGMFEPERYGVPSFYELVLIANDAALARRRPVLARFVGAVARGLRLTAAQPSEAFNQYVALNPTLNDAFNRRSFEATLPTFARSQQQQRGRWAAFDDWMAARHVIPAPVAVDQLYTNVVTQP
ncbi:MAG TPA: ABC transporter substrate-binding protein [bacterium]|nr:ABC transporter substrate-binding protein [bacterium]